MDPTASPVRAPSGVRVLHHDVAERPFIVFWEVTRACTLACRHCRADANPNHHPMELTTHEAFAVIDDLAALGSPRPILVLTGGDPFERDDLVDIVRHGADSGLAMAISPSATPNLTRERLAELHAAGAGALSLSLDGARPATHDAIRGIAGVHAHTMTAAATAVDIGYRLQINTTVTADNVDELPELLAWVIDAGVTLWSVFLLVPTGRGAQLRGLASNEVEEVLHWLHEIGDLVPVKTTEAPQFRRVAMQRAAVDDPDAVYPAGPLRRRLRARTHELVAADHAVRHRRPPLSVNAGRGVAFIDHVGTIFPSGFLPLPVGSVRQRPLSEWYRVSPLMQSLRDPDQFTGKCARCEYRTMCGGSRSRAFAASGDPLGDDPACDYTPALLV
jgi:radical SAM protein